MKARVARLDDDLSTIWPEIAQGCTVNRDQVLVAESDEGALIGGLIFVDGGHWVIYCESLRAAGRIYVVKALVQALHEYARREGRLLIAWVVPEGPFADLLLKEGCEDQGAHRYLIRQAHAALPWERADA